MCLMYLVAGVPDPWIPDRCTGSLTVTEVYPARGLSRSFDFRADFMPIYSPSLVLYAQGSQTDLNLKVR